MRESKKIIALFLFSNLFAPKFPLVDLSLLPKSDQEKVQEWVKESVNDIRMSKVAIEDLAVTKKELSNEQTKNDVLVSQVTDLNKENKKLEGVWRKTKGPIKLCLSVTALIGAGYAIYYIFIKKTSSSRTPTDIREEEFRKKIISNELQRQVNSIEIQENTLRIQRQQLAAKTSDDNKATESNAQG